MTAEFTTAIVPSDFVKRTTDYEYKHFGVEAMTYLVQALREEPVAIVVDSYTGFTLMDVTLVSVRPRAGRDSRVRLRRNREDGSYSDTDYRIDDVSVIIPMTKAGSQAKWNALHAIHQDRMRVATSA